MKKIFLLITVLLSAVLMIGCSLENTSIHGEKNGREETSGNIEAVRVDVNEREDNMDYENRVEFLSALDEYVASDDVSEALLEMYKAADTVKSIPVLGTYLEETDVVAYMFFKNGSICSTALLSFSTNGDPINIELTEFAETDIDKYPYIDAHSNESCYASIQNCLSIDPDFEILGIVFNTKGYPSTLPVGRCKGETVIKYHFNQPMSFNLVEPFESIEEGRAAFAKYLAENDAIKAQLPIFLWETTKFYENGFWRPYSLDYIYDDTEEYKNKILPFIEAGNIDSWIAIPLLDEGFNEGVLISHLLYYRNQLMGEVVIKSNPSGDVVAAYANLAVKDADGTYVAMEKSEYQKTIEKARELYPDIEIEGVIFKDGKYMPFGHTGEEIVYLVE